MTITATSATIPSSVPHNHIAEPPFAQARRFAPPISVPPHEGDVDGVACHLLVADCRYLLPCWKSRPFTEGDCQGLRRTRAMSSAVASRRRQPTRWIGPRGMAVRVRCPRRLRWHSLLVMGSSAALAIGAMRLLGLLPEEGAGCDKLWDERQDLDRRGRQDGDRGLHVRNDGQH